MLTRSRNAAALQPAAVPTAGGGVTYTMHVPDTVVPAILGRGGAVIREIMEQSGEFFFEFF